MMIPTEMLCKHDGKNQSDNDGVDLLRASHCAVFGAQLSKDKTVKCININLLKYKLNKTHEGISEARGTSRVVDPRHLRMVLQKTHDRFRIVAMPLHAQWKRFHAQQNQKGVVRRQGRTDNCAASRFGNAPHRRAVRTFPYTPCRGTTAPVA